MSKLGGTGNRGSFFGTFEQFGWGFQSFFLNLEILIQIYWLNLQISASTRNFDSPGYYRVLSSLSCSTRRSCSLLVRARCSWAIRSFRSEIWLLWSDRLEFRLCTLSLCIFSCNTHLGFDMLVTSYSINLECTILLYALKRFICLSISKL